MVGVSGFKTSSKMVEVIMMVTHINNRQYWTNFDIELIREMAEQGLSYWEMHESIGHTPGSIQLKMELLGIPYKYKKQKQALVTDNYKVYVSPDLPAHRNGDRINYSR